MKKRAVTGWAPSGWRWLLLSITSNSGCNLFACNLCGLTTKGAVKWEYHDCRPERQDVMLPRKVPRERGGISRARAKRKGGRGR